MTLEQFNSHGWKATDKVVYKDNVYSILHIYFETKSMFIKNAKRYEVLHLHIRRLELYQPLTEAHTHLLTELS